ncbi:MAG: FCD domain-containing protein [Arcanobacterium sp.]|nr:FCD domain-containing protein [Arcanobacterium sp.]
MSAASKQHLLDVAHHLAQIEPGHEAQILDSEYHELLVAGAEDRTISALLKVLRKRGRDYHIYESVEHVNLKAISDAAHIEIAQAIQRSDPHLASLLAAQHIETTRSWLIEYRPEPQLFE